MTSKQWACVLRRGLNAAVREAPQAQPLPDTHPASACRTSRLSLFVSLFALCGPFLFFRVPQVSPPTSRVASFVTLRRLFAHPPSGSGAAISSKATALALQAPPTPHLDARLVAKSAGRVAKSDTPPPTAATLSQKERKSAQADKNPESRRASLVAKSESRVAKSASTAAQSASHAPFWGTVAAWRVSLAARSGSRAT